MVPGFEILRGTQYHHVVRVHNANEVVRITENPAVSEMQDGKVRGASVPPWWLSRSGSIQNTVSVCSPNPALPAFTPSQYLESKPVSVGRDLQGIQIAFVVGQYDRTMPTKCPVGAKVYRTCVLYHKQHGYKSCFASL